MDRLTTNGKIDELKDSFDAIFIRKGEKDQQTIIDELKDSFNAIKRFLGLLCKTDR